MRIPALVFVVSLVTLTACPTQNPQERCAPSCLGCCDLAGACQAGQSVISCGANGNACIACGFGLQCIGGQCGTVNAGGGSGGGTGGGSGGGSGGGVGGGAGGGTVSVVDQELVSGTRLRAIVSVSGDGAKSAWLGSAYFWDNQLETICTELASSGSFEALAGVHPCVPIGSQGGEDFIDSACANGSVARPTERVFGRNMKAYLEQYGADGGVQYFVVSTTPFVGTVYRFSGPGMCDPAGASDGGQFPKTGAPVSLATFTPTIE